MRSKLAGVSMAMEDMKKSLDRENALRVSAENELKDLKMSLVKNKLSKQLETLAIQNALQEKHMLQMELQLQRLDKSVDGRSENDSKEDIAENIPEDPIVNPETLENQNFNANCSNIIIRSCTKKDEGNKLNINKKVGFECSELLEKNCPKNDRPQKSKASSLERHHLKNSDIKKCLQEFDPLYHLN
ncbi:hypothetical protein HELRODRAFT_170155 [Helobdella robusta]|uniref:Uncharacterized protein n=1 Tax=Helobdella robusta TaxID=6412 RepID=T1F2Q3_HELRO|nr:hypothetical protein HELRODRAFT_170155 [Helobdella robusta]ESO07611.1 hypothetical protein HELRODRAFT_170155 [Helobdella robusta]